jgi:hypothetical protein
VAENAVSSSHEDVLSVDMPVAREVVRAVVDVTFRAVVVVAENETSDDAAVYAAVYAENLGACTGRFLDLVLQP